jgi:hypothetical protein
LLQLLVSALFEVVVGLCIWYISEYALRVEGNIYTETVDRWDFYVNHIFANAVRQIIETLLKVPYCD